MFSYSACSSKRKERNGKGPLTRARSLHLAPLSLFRLLHTRQLLLISGTWRRRASSYTQTHASPSKGTNQSKPPPVSFFSILNSQ